MAQIVAAAPTFHALLKTHDLGANSYLVRRVFRSRFQI